MTSWSLQDQLAAIIDMLLDRHPMGLRVLVGEAPPPTAEEIHLMYAAGRYSEDLGVRVDGGVHITKAEQLVTDEERFKQIIDRAGGWQHITSTARAWEEHKPKTWKIIEDHVTWVASGSISRIDDSQLRRVALKHGLSPETIQRHRRGFAAELAGIILKSRPYLDLRWCAGPTDATDYFLNAVDVPVDDRVDVSVDVPVDVG